MSKKSSNKKRNHLSFRLAETEDDFERFLPLSIAFHEEAYFSRYQHDNEKRTAALRKALDQPDRFCLMLAEYRATPAGFLYCSVGDYIIGKGPLVATAFSIYVSPDFRGSLLGGRIATGLLRGAIRWSKNRRAHDLLFHVTSGIAPERMDRFMRRAGAKFLGGNYAFNLQQKDESS